MSATAEVVLQCISFYALLVSKIIRWIYWGSLLEVYCLLSLFYLLNFLPHLASFCTVLIALGVEGCKFLDSMCLFFLILFISRCHLLLMNRWFAFPPFPSKLLAGTNITWTYWIWLVESHVSLACNCLHPSGRRAYWWKSERRTPWLSGESIGWIQS